MGLAVTRISLQDWRSFADNTMDLSEGLTILCGPNATGKTNTVEALQLLTAGASFRRPRTLDLVRQGADAGRVRARLEGDGRVVDVQCDVQGSKRRFVRNDKPCRPSDLSSTLMSVLFCPDDLSFVKQGAKYRRDELDDFGAQASAGYRKVSRTYARAVEQRNRLLKEEHPDLGLLEAWDASVALGGATLLHARLSMFARVRDHVRAIYAQVGGGEELDCAYVCTLGEDVADLSRDDLRDLFLERLAQVRGEELRRGVTLVGPQRDDVTFAIAGRDARTFGSQGQQRSVVLAWKMAEVAIAREVLGEQPLLLLDDVMSELDETRRAAMTRFVQGGIQTVVTTTNLSYFPPELLETARVIAYGT
ncbi:MAG: DNA replication and repair protein RecF [Atopobiaceae bacterium]|jgi:DNA replication and repair protein RecF|nr:DNA replication and repair protein RecF [Atopobiaceae bacterium]